MDDLGHPQHQLDTVGASIAPGMDRKDHLEAQAPLERTFKSPQSTIHRADAQKVMAGPSGEPHGT